jgi:hypothetical protein
VRKHDVDVLIVALIVEVDVLSFFPNRNQWMRAQHGANRDAMRELYFVCDRTPYVEGEKRYSGRTVRLRILATGKFTAEREIKFFSFTVEN